MINQNCKCNGEGLGAIQKIYFQPATDYFYGSTANEIFNEISLKVTNYRCLNLNEPEFIIMHPEQMAFLKNDFNKKVALSKPIIRMTKPKIFGIKVLRTKDLKPFEILIK